jgi:hypothetical protein
MSGPRNSVRRRVDGWRRLSSDFDRKSIHHEAHEAHEEVVATSAAGPKRSGWRPKAAGDEANRRALVACDGSTKVAIAQRFVVFVRFVVRALWTRT